MGIGEIVGSINLVMELSEIIGPKVKKVDRCHKPSGQN